MSEGNPRVTMKTNEGEIILELDAVQAPETVSNFLQYVDESFFDGLIFHRVIDGFMIQGGGFTAQMEQKQVRNPIRNEAANGLKNKKGTIAMARTSEIHSATAQFFINVSDNDFLDHRDTSPAGYGYAVFGAVVSGMDVVDRIRKVQTGAHGYHRDVPRTPVVIESIRRS